VDIKIDLSGELQWATGLSWRRRVSSVLSVCAVALAIVAAAARGMDMGGAPGGGSSSRDLTGLSLEELYNMDIVQPNVLGGHTHPAGEAMFGYDYMHMSMTGLYEGTHQVSPAHVFGQNLNGITVVHTSMQMDMQMVDLMYAPSDRLTLMAMESYKTMSMDHLKSDGGTFSQWAQGYGDLEAMGLITILGDIRKGGNRLVLNLGMSFPTGPIDVRDHADGIPSNPDKQLEYLMQMGSGTFDPMPGLTYLGDSGRWSWGAQNIETVRLGRNYHNYRLGDEYKLSAWTAYGVTDWFAPSIRLDGRDWGEITGQDPALAANPTAEGKAYLRGGDRLDLLFGLNFMVPKGVLKCSRFMIEGGLPVYQNLQGPQLGTAWMLTAGFSYGF
jgi:hypothetical protein